MKTATYWDETRSAMEKAAPWRTAQFSAGGADIVRRSQHFIVTGSGSSWPVAILAKHWLTAAKKTCCALTPQQLRNYVGRIDVGIVFSTQFTHTDAIYSWRWLRHTGAHRIVVTSNASVVKLARRASTRDRVLHPLTLQPAAGWVPVAPPLLLLREFATLFGHQRRRVVERMVTQRLQLPRLPSKLVGLVVVFSRDGEAAAHNIATRLHEAGACLCTASDLWNFRHGLFMPLVTRPSDKMVVFLGSKTEQARLRECRSLLPVTVRCFELTSAKSGVIGALELFFSSFVLVSELLERIQVDAANPKPPPWCGTLYEARLS